VAVREILGNLTRKEVKVKYTSSVLGALWSLLNPVLYLAVFSLVFAVVLPNKVPDFPVYLLSGILAWNFFSSSLGLASRSVVDNANLVTKVYFPREILPLASVGAASVDFGLQSIVLLGFMAIIRYPFLGVNLLLLPLALLALYAFTVAMSFWVAALNVRYRDTQQPVEHRPHAVVLAHADRVPSALIYNELQPHRFLQDLFLANPMGVIVMGFQRALYRITTPLVTDPVTHRLGRARCCRRWASGGWPWCGRGRRRLAPPHAPGLADVLPHVGRLRGGAVTGPGSASADLAVVIEGVGKRFKRYREKPATLKERLIASGRPRTSSGPFAT